MSYVIMKRITLCALLMTLFLLLSCGSGSTSAEDPKTTFLTSIANLGKGFLDVFTSLSDMVAGVFGIKADTKKSDIGKYFSDIEKTVTSVKKKLNTVVAENGNYPKIKGVVDNFITNTLDKIAAGAKTAATGATGGAVGEVVKSDSAGNGPDAESIKSLVKGIKTIVDLVLKEGDPKADKTTPVDDDKKDIGRLFGAKNEASKGAEEKHVAAAGAVTGADILKAIAAADSNATKDGKVKDATDAAALALAKGTGTANDEKLTTAEAEKDAVIAAGIALRAMAKDGKFIVKDTAVNKTEAEAAKGVAASAVGKALSTLIIAIRDTVDTGLKSISDALAAVKQGDKSADSTTPAEAATGSQKQSTFGEIMSPGFDKFLSLTASLSIILSSICLLISSFSASSATLSSCSFKSSIVSVNCNFSSTFGEIMSPGFGKFLSLFSLSILSCILSLTISLCLSNLS
uniref:Variable large protein n=1 Tax=Borrelia puertoricensis TaxID=2756107 RepID=A0AA51UMU7_9SPIR|nr:hypothetical protein MHINFGKF_00038 [Borrelia puertoricensis]